MINKPKYSGIGSRETPDAVCKLFSSIASSIEENYILRSGGASGADSAFEAGVKYEENKEIFLPYKGCFGHNSELYTVAEEAIQIAKEIRGGFYGLNNNGILLHGRNVYQILGKYLNDPVKFVLCWTPQGKIKGGTATAIKLATKYNIPILNFGIYNNIDSMKEAFFDFTILNEIIINEYI